MQTSAHTPNQIPLESPEDREFYYSDAQSIGACMEHMALAAHSLGIASLWLCDVLYAEDGISQVVGGERRKLTAALVLGYRNNDAFHYVASRHAPEDMVIGTI